MSFLSIKFFQRDFFISASLPLIASVFAIGSSVSRPAHAFRVTFEDPGTQNSTKGSIFEIDFDDTGTDEIDVNGSDTVSNGGVTYSYTDNYEIITADQFGGADGIGEYIGNTSSNARYSVSIDQDQDYFGFWWSAGDSDNRIEFYNDGNLLFTFNTNNIVNLLPNNSTSTITSIDGSSIYNTQAYYGNPTATFSGQNSNEPYAFINFYAEGSEVFDRIDFYQTDDSGIFESDNHTFSASSPSIDESVEVEVPFNFSPTIGLLLCGMSLLGIKHLKKRRTSKTN